MKSFARKTLAWILLAFAFLIESFWSLVGLVAITYGAWLIYAPAGWIVGGLLLLAASELHYRFPKHSSGFPEVNGVNSGAI